MPVVVMRSAGATGGVEVWDGVVEVARGGVTDADAEVDGSASAVADAQPERAAAATATRVAANRAGLRGDGLIVLPSRRMSGPMSMAPLGGNEVHLYTGVGRPWHTRPWRRGRNGWWKGRSASGRDRERHGEQLAGSRSFTDTPRVAQMDPHTGSARKRDLSASNGGTSLGRLAA